MRRLVATLLAHRQRPVGVVRALVAITVAVVMLGAAATAARAFDRTDIPLKNWGGFALHQDPIYEDLERLVMAGFADRVVLNTRPLSRIEAARIVATAIAKIRNDTDGDYNDRRDLEDVLDRLMKEFTVELASLGVRTTAADVSPHGVVSFVPVDRAQVYGAYANHHIPLVNSQGRDVRRGANGGFTFETRAQVGDILSFYLQPELLQNEDYGAARLVTGYAKLTVYNIELMIGRESLAWGPGYHNQTMVSNNAAPLEQIRLATSEPFRLPWIGRWLGPTKLMVFLAQLEQRRDHPFAKLSGVRLTMAPASWLELGFNRTQLFDGLHPNLPLSQYPNAIFNPGYGSGSARPTHPSDSLLGVDGEVRVSNVNRFLVPARDVALYADVYWDDTCGECIPSGIGHFFASNFLPNRRTLGIVGGIHVVGLLGNDWLESRVEYAQTGPQSYNHDQFTTGYWTRGHVLGDFIGTDGSDYFARLIAHATPDVMLGLEIDRAIIGQTSNHPLPEERRTGAGVDVSVRFARVYSVFAQYLFSDVRNRRFNAGSDGWDHLLRVELTRSFR